MKLEQFSYSPGSGWSAPSFPDLDSDQTLVVVFGASEYVDDPAPLRELRAAYPQSQLVGCSTSGEIEGSHINDRSIAVAVVKFESTRLHTAVASVSETSESFEAGKNLASRLLGPDLKGILVFSDGLNVNGSELIRGLNSQLPGSVVVTGGLAGDGDRFERTWTLQNGLPEPGAACAVGLYGDKVHIGHGSRGGWDMFGPKRRVTKSEANVLYELDDLPALELYKKYLGERAAELPASALLFPLALRIHADDEKVVVRTILSVDEESQSMVFAGDIPENHYVQLMRANFDRLIDGAADAAEAAEEGLESMVATEVLSIAISCVGRRLILGERTEEELEAALASLPDGTRQIGFYSYGEISPYASGYCDLHNQTMTLTTISED